MKYDLLIRGGQVVRDRVEAANIAIADEKIIAIAPEIPGDARETIDATGLHVFPGVIDPHVHFNEPGRTEWEGISTGSAALVAGGGTCFFDMPLNSSPPVLDGESFDLKLAAMKQKSLTDFGLWGGLTPSNLERMEELAERGVVGFKAFMCDSGIDDFPYADPETLRRGMKIAAKVNLPVAVHAEDPDLTSKLTAEARAAGRTAPADFVATRPVEAEVKAIRAAVALAKETGASLHVVHVSTMAGAVACRFPKLESISCETCPHYFTFSEEDLSGHGATLKCAPPLRSKDEMNQLGAVVKSMLTPIIASDHSPAPPHMKQSDNFFNVWGGIAGVQSTLLATLTLIGDRPRQKLQMISWLTSTIAAQRFGIESKGRIEAGFDADFALVDIAGEYTLRRDDLLDRHKLSPYVGRKFRGRVRRTIVRGRTVFLDRKVISKPIGRLVRPA